MKQQIAIISNLENVLWLESIRDRLDQLGEVNVVNEQEVDELNGRLQANLILIDSSSVLKSVAYIQYLQEANPTVPQIVVTASPTWRRARDVLKAGAHDYIKQTDNNKIIASCTQLLKVNYYRLEAGSLKSE